MRSPDQPGHCLAKTCVAVVNVLVLLGDVAKGLSGGIRSEPANASFPPACGVLAMERMIMGCLPWSEMYAGDAAVASARTCFTLRCCPSDGIAERTLT